MFDRPRYSFIQNFILLVARSWIAYAFLLHGTAKFFEYPISMTGGHGSVALLSLHGVGGILEISAGIAIALGIFSRFFAFLVAGQMAYAYWFIHASHADFWLPIVNKGELASVYCMVFLIIAFITGSGEFSIESLFANARQAKRDREFEKFINAQSGGNTTEMYTAPPMPVDQENFEELKKTLNLDKQPEESLKTKIIDFK